MPMRPTLTMGQVQTTSGGQLAAATLTGGDVSIDFIAAGHNSYNHATGVGGAYGNRSIGPNGVEESLEGQDFACGDKIVYFAAVTVDAGAGNGDVDLNFSFDGTTTSGRWSASTTSSVRRSTRPTRATRTWTATRPFRSRANRARPLPART